MKNTIDVDIRRAPKYGVFIGAGAVLGVLAGGILALIPFDTSGLSQEYSRAAIIGLGLVFLAMAGAMLGGIAALIMDFVSRKRARTVQVVGYFEQSDAAAPAAADAPNAAAPAASAEPQSEQPEAERNAEG